MEKYEFRVPTNNGTMPVSEALNKADEIKIKGRTPHEEIALLRRMAVVANEQLGDTDNLTKNDIASPEVIEAMQKEFSIENFLDLENEKSQSPCLIIRDHPLSSENNISFRYPMQSVELGFSQAIISYLTAQMSANSMSGGYKRGICPPGNAIFYPIKDTLLEQISEIYPHSSFSEYPNKSELNKVMRYESRDIKFTRISDGVCDITSEPGPVVTGVIRKPGPDIIPDTWVDYQTLIIKSKDKYFPWSPKTRFLFSIYNNVMLAYGNNSLPYVMRDNLNSDFGITWFTTMKETNHQIFYSYMTRYIKLSKDLINNFEVMNGLFQFMSEIEFIIKPGESINHCEYDNFIVKMENDLDLVMMAICGKSGQVVGDVVKSFQKKVVNDVKVLFSSVQARAMMKSSLEAFSKVSAELDGKLKKLYSQI